MVSVQSSELSVDNKLQNDSLKQCSTAKLLLSEQGFAPIGILGYWNNAFWGNAMLFPEAKTPTLKKPT